MPRTGDCGAKALALGAIDSGVELATGYPGSPATAVMDALIEQSDERSLRVEWCPNEKVAVEMALGASMAAARSLVVVKSVGMNACVDPLMVANLTGTGAGTVVLLGDDPGAQLSQNDQDTRSLVIFEELPLIEPATPQDGYAAVRFGFRLSEEVHLPVVVRFTRAFAAGEGAVRREPPSPTPSRSSTARRRYISTTSNVLANHRALHEKLKGVGERFEQCAANRIEGNGRTAVVAAGRTYVLLRQALDRMPAPQFRVLKLATLFPLPVRVLREALSGVGQALVLEENEPLIERQLAALAWRAGARPAIAGRLTGHLPREGELTAPLVAEALGKLTDASGFAEAARQLAEPRPEPSVGAFCDGCPYVAVFEELERAIARLGLADRVIAAGDPGCMVKAIHPPFELFDVKLCMGSSIACVAGAVRADPGRIGMALVGDSSFFHSGVNALFHVAAQRIPLLVLILDNSGAALTGGQPHPGTARDARGNPATPVRIEDVVRCCTPSLLARLDPSNRAVLGTQLERALGANGLRVLLVRAPCPAAR